MIVAIPVIPSVSLQRYRSSVNGCRSSCRQRIPRRIFSVERTSFRLIFFRVAKEKRIPEIAERARRVSETGKDSDRQLTVFGAAIYPCQAIEVIAVSVVNSGPNNPAGRVFLPRTLSFSVCPFLSLRCFLWRKAQRGGDRRTLATSVFRGLLRGHRSSP